MLSALPAFLKEGQNKNGAPRGSQRGRSSCFRLETSVDLSSSVQQPRCQTQRSTRILSYGQQVGYTFNAFNAMGGDRPLKSWKDLTQRVTC